MRKRYLMTLGALILSACCMSQSTTLTPSASDSLNKVYTNGIDVVANFPGGANAWRKYLQKNLNPLVPVNNGAPPGTYHVIVRFIVSTDGTITDVRPETKHGYGMEDAAVKLIKNGPKWEPGVRQGRKINSYRRQSVTFVISKEF